MVAPDLHVVQEYGSRANLAERPGFPPQRSDLSYGLYGSQEQYFIPPTPGKANSPGYPSISGEPIFSRESGTYTGYILLELRSPNPAAEIRYTLDGQIPTLASTKYTAAIPITSTREVLARAYEPGKAPSAVVSRTYIALANDVLSFSSNLPIVIVDTEPPEHRHQRSPASLPSSSTPAPRAGPRSPTRRTSPDAAGSRNEAAAPGRKPSPNTGSKYGTRTIGTGTSPFSACPPTPTGFCTLPTPSTGP